MRQGEVRTGRACGKAIVVGEHFVLYGVPAVAVPVEGRHVEVRVEATGRPGVEFVGPEAGREVALAMIAHLGLSGVRVIVGGDLPMSAGLGSSAALAVALVRARGDLQGAEAFAMAHALEQIAHGRASGIDDAVISRQSPLRYVSRPEAAPLFTPLVAPPLPLWIAWVPRTRSTREAVAGVARFAAERPAAFSRCRQETAALVEPVIAALEAGDHPRLGALMGKAQMWLDGIGVVVDEHRRICELALSAGAMGAKTTGAGWGGAVLIVGARDLELDRLLADRLGTPCIFAGAGA